MPDFNNIIGGNILPSFDIPSIRTSEFMPKIPKMGRQTPKTVVILGNGFDIDLGMHTTYMQFAKSDYWPFNGKVYDLEGTLGRFLNDKRDIEKWLNLEEALGEYANIKKSNQNIEEDKSCYNLLVNKLYEYIENEQETFTFGSGVPAGKVLLDKIKEKDYHIYSFNYTNLYKLAKKMFIDLAPERINYIHGSLKDNDIILGTGDVCDLPEEYYWLYKSFNPHYQSNKLVEDLADADEVFIFGHSLGRNDHDYIYDFFQRAITKRDSRFVPEGYERIKIRIFTKDESSEFGIKTQLRTLTNKHLIGLYAHCDLRIFHTMGDVNWFLEDF